MIYPAEPQTIWFFFVEKNLYQYQRHNNQNNRWSAYSPKDTPRIMQSKFSKTDCFSVCVSCEGDVMPPYFFKEYLSLNSDTYVELLLTVVKPWITRVANGRPYVWQQDSDPCHTSGKSKKWLLANFFHYTSLNVCPPNSPDLNPMDYYVWFTVEKDTNCYASTTETHLIDRIKSFFSPFPGKV